ncbi:hypothetical protein ACFXJ8_02365 [Nonomuraea sp. NPDC059194]
MTTTGLGEVRSGSGARECLLQFLGRSSDPAGRTASGQATMAVALRALT